MLFRSAGVRRYANDVHYFECDMGKCSRWMRCEALSGPMTHWTCAVFPHISHDQVTHDKTFIHCRGRILVLHSMFVKYRH